MAKMIRVVALVAVEKLADALDALADITESVTLENGAVAQSASSAAADDDDDVPVVRSTRPVMRRQVTTPAAARPAARLGGRVVYTPAGTQRQITKLLDDLRGSKTMRAFVLADLAKHPGSTNKEVRERIAKLAAKNGLSVESVDNIVWKMVNDGTITKRAEA